MESRVATKSDEPALRQLPEPPYARGTGTHLQQVLDEEGREVAAVPPLAGEDLRSFYEWMLRVRTFEARLVSLQRQGRITFCVTGAGEEAVMVGTAAALQPQDWAFPAYREMGVALYRGLPLADILAQMVGSRRDLLKGRQMPNHFGSARYRFAVASSPVGTQIPHAVGAAWSARLQGEDSVAAAYFGDGATSTGDFHAGLNFAAVQQLPVVFFCRNNGWAISLPVARQTRVEALADKAAGYGMPGLRVDGNDVLAVYRAAGEAVEWARSGSGPMFLEFVTQRMSGHSTADDPARYRDPELLEPWKKKDPLPRFGAWLRSQGLWDQADEERLRNELDREFTLAFEEAAKEEPPPLSSLFDDLYREVPWHLREQRDELLGSS